MATSRRGRDEDDKAEEVQQRRIAYNAAASRSNGCGLTLMNALLAAAARNSDTNGGAAASLAPRFQGVLKEKFSDFIVRERNPHPLRLGAETVRPECRDPPPPVQAQPTGLPSADKIRDVLGAAATPAAAATDESASAAAAAAVPLVIGSKENLDALLAAAAQAEITIREIEAAKASAAAVSDSSASAAAASNRNNNNNNNNRKRDAKPAGAQVPPVTLPTPFTDKLARARAHQAIKQCGFHDSRTESDGKISVQLVGAGLQRHDERFSNFGRNPQQLTHVVRPGTCTVERGLWPKGRGEYLHFTLYKENIESGAALRHLAGKMGVPVRCLQYCGNKDKRAVTTQRVSGRFLSAEAVAALNGMSFGRSCVVRVGDFEYRDEPLQLGKLLGNGFTIALRRVTPPEIADGSNPALLHAFEQSLRQHGFANYYGPQRFGTTSIASYEMGEALLRGDYERTLLLVMRSKVEVCPDFAPALRAFVAGDMAGALRVCPYHCTTERDCLIQLSQRPRDFCAAVMALPRPLTMLYCHSLQSLIWNKMVARRLELAPCVLVGDIVLAAAGTASGAAAVAAAAAAASKRPNDDDGDDAASAANKKEDENDGAGEEDEDGGGADDTASGPLPAVRFVTQQDIDAGRYTLADVLLPIPGSDPDLQFPQNAVSGRAAYEEAMLATATAQEASNLKIKTAEENEEQQAQLDESSAAAGKATANIVESLLSSASKFAERHFHIHGAYRNMVVVPLNLTLRAVSYSRDTDLLIETDLDALRKKQREAAAAPAPAVPTTTAPASADAAPSKHAVIASFELPSGSYATSVLREMCDTV